MERDKELALFLEMRRRDKGWADDATAAEMLLSGDGNYAHGDGMLPLDPPPESPKISARTCTSRLPNKSSAPSRSIVRLIQEVLYLDWILSFISQFLSCSSAES